MDLIVLGGGLDRFSGLCGCSLLLCCGNVFLLIEFLLFVLLMGFLLGIALGQLSSIFVRYFEELESRIGVLCSILFL